MVKIIDNETGLYQAKLLFPLPLLSFSFAMIMASFLSRLLVNMIKTGSVVSVPISVLKVGSYKIPENIQSFKACALLWSNCLLALR
jgi:hypothetical protein